MFEDFCNARQWRQEAQKNQGSHGYHDCQKFMLANTSEVKLKYGLPAAAPTMPPDKDRSRRSTFGRMTLERVVCFRMEVTVSMSEMREREQQRADTRWRGSIRVLLQQSNGKRQLSIVKYTHNG